MVTSVITCNSSWLDTLIPTAIGSIFGAGFILLIEFIRRKYRIKIEEFNNCIKQQLALIQMINIILQIYRDHESQKKAFINDCNKSALTKEKWKKFKCIDLRRFNQLYSFIDLDWNLSQYLSKKSGFRRDMLQYLIPARAGYQTLCSVIDIRNALLDQTLNKLCQFKDNNRTNGDDYLYQSNNLENIVGEKLLYELKDTTDHYINSIRMALEDCYQTYNKMGSYIDKCFKYCKFFGSKFESLPMPINHENSILEGYDLFLCKKKPNTEQLKLDAVYVYLEDNILRYSTSCEESTITDLDIIKTTKEIASTASIKIEDNKYIDAFFKEASKQGDIFLKKTTKQL